MATLGFRPAVDPETGEQHLVVDKRGIDLLKSPLLNKGTAFPLEEREAFGLWGLLPDHVSTMEEQVSRARYQYDQKTTDLGRNIHLNNLLDRNETLFYRFVLDHLEETVPIIYTPTVAQACSHWSRIFRRARGIYITAGDRGRMTTVLRSRPKWDRPVIVVTDNERILGIGDQGAGGMGIPIGKLALYAATAGIHPARLVPISLDIGTENEELLADPLYLGVRDHRMRGADYESFIAEFVAAVQEAYPGALLQWEDFANRTSFANLEAYRDVLPSFNDDIQGTAAVAVGGILAATRHLGARMRDHRVVIVGAGSAGVGIRDLVVAAMREDGAADVAERVFVLDSKGLVSQQRADLGAMKQRVAAPAAVVTGWGDGAGPADLEAVVRGARATVLIGVSGVAGVFTEAAVRQMARNGPHPIIMPMSNPTSLTEVEPEWALRWTGGSAVVATGSPFPPVSLDGEVHVIGQANNVFVFPGMGLGVLAVGARKVTEGMFLAAAHAMSAAVSDDDLKAGSMFPTMAAAPATATAVAVAVAGRAIEEGVADPVGDVEAVVAASRWAPHYLPYRPA
ncbi:MAG TPA: NAD-dependent malic enzyme [Acidimicrobiia bacterium]|jgi:malic enzyme